MRAILAVLFILLFLNCIYAQDQDLKEIYTKVTTSINSALLTKKGSTELSGFFSFNYLKTKFDYDESITEQIVQIEPGFSYFYFDNISFGIILSYYYQKIDYESTQGARSSDQIFIGPLVKYYFSEDKLRPFVLSDYLVQSGDELKGGEWDIGGGVLYHVTGNFGLSLQLKYGFIWSDIDHIDNQNRIFIGVGFSNFIL